MLLARKGYRVLMVDRAGFPSDTVSTHMIHAPGVAALCRWGVLDQIVASNCPPVDRYSFDFGPFTLSGRVLARTRIGIDRIGEDRVGELGQRRVAPIDADVAVGRCSGPGRCAVTIDPHRGQADPLRRCVVVEE
jgi:hypothetical protein